MAQEVMSKEEARMVLTNLQEEFNGTTRVLVEMKEAVSNNELKEGIDRVVAAMDWIMDWQGGID